MPRSAIPVWERGNLKLTWSDGSGGMGPLTGMPDVPLPTAPLFLTGLTVLREKANKTYSIRLANSGFTDANLPRLVEALHHSDCVLRELDLSFNHLTDDGLLSLCKTLAYENLCGFELTHIYVGGNPISDAGFAAAGEALHRDEQRSDVVLDATPLLRGAETLCLVGKVFAADSPAGVAGLQPGDAIVAFGSVHQPGKMPHPGFKSDTERMWDAMGNYKSVADTLAPIVAASVGLNIDLVVARAAPMGGAAGAAPTHVRLGLTPGKWAGEGLLGCKVKEPKKPDVAAKPGVAQTGTDGKRAMA